jgi:hypothetical protein
VVCESNVISLPGGRCCAQEALQCQRIVKIVSMSYELCDELDSRVHHWSGEEGNEP